jgi:ATP-binding cassette subfamily B protein
MDCGPTCLKMVARYYSRYFSLERLRNLSYISPIGTSLRGLIKSAEFIGFETQCLQIPFSILISEIKLPCIIHWNSNHFCVLYKIKNNKIFYIIDPNVGRLKYSDTEFKERWLKYQTEDTLTGIVLTLNPTPEFYENETTEKKSNFLTIFKYIKPYKKLIIQLVIGLIIGSFLQLLIPFLTQKTVDYAIPNKRLDFIYLILAAQLVIIISSSSVELIRGWILLHFGTRINISLISDFLSKLIKLPISFFDSRRTGDILQRIRDYSRIETFLTNHSLNIIFSFFNILIFGTIILLYNYIIFIIYFVGCGIYIVWALAFMRKRAEIDHDFFEHQSENQSYLVEFVTAMQDMKINSCEKKRKNEWAQIQSKLYNTRIRSLGLSQYQDTGGLLINQIKNLVISAVVATFVVKGSLTIGMMIAIQYILGQLNAPIDSIISFFRVMQDANLSYERLEEIHNIKDEINTDNSNLISNIPKGLDIDAKNLSFQYNLFSVIPTINNLNLKIQNGKQTAIVGVSGSGKTTIIKLLLGFYTSYKGGIFLGETDFRDYNVDSWRKKCGVVMQDGYIYNDSVSGNIAPSEDIVDQERMIYSCEIAMIKEFIETLPQKYNTKIGKEGLGLSQGQKQRILIARAVYKNPEFIFFDEATNALDANNEKAIMKNLQKFFKGKTSIIVAHRLSTVRDADQIIVIDGGQIKEIGNHQDLIEQKGRYYELVKNQLNI